MTETKIAIIRVRGPINVRKVVGDTLKMLKLHRKNYCVVIPDTPSYRGMIYKVKDYVTWGTIDEETLKLLTEKKGEKKGENLKPFFRLNPPVKGFGRKGIKKAFAVGGALGDRKEKINDLIRRML
jgi:large subunit ribosomal protein L30